MKKLPIYDVIDDIKACLEINHELVLQAPPGAGKTTVVPLSLMTQPWCRGKILVLEPRRMAARAAAERMAKALGEKIGDRVGYRIRQETRIGPNTKIEIVTGGVLTRLLQNDPSLEEYSIIIFDEFHERNIDSDLGLTLALHGRELFRENNNPLKLLIMSATINGEEISHFLNDAQIINSEGRMYPVDIRYTGNAKLINLIDSVYNTTLDALNQHKGNILVFLPGQKEIRDLQKKLHNKIDDSVLIAPLYGNLPLAQQMKAIEAIDTDNSGFKRKVVLSTDIAETSLTIDGVTVVVDSGLRREPMFDTRTGLTRLQTNRISHASATQRMGRAGRLAPGICYRVWSQENVLQAFSKAEIEQADLVPLALQILAFGISIDTNAESDELQWITSPPNNAFQKALALLESLGAVKKGVHGFQITKQGKTMADFPAHPRLANMMLIAAQYGLSEEASMLASTLSEPSRPDCIGSDVAEWLHKIKNYTNESHRQTLRWFEHVNKQAARFHRALKGITAFKQAPTDCAIGFLLALAYPERVAKKRSDDSSIYQLGSGRLANIASSVEGGKAPWICAAELGGSSQFSEDRIYSAVKINPDLFASQLSNLVEITEHAEWDNQLERFVAEKRWLVGKLIWKSQKTSRPNAMLKIQVICAMIRQKGLNILGWNPQSRQWCARVELLRLQSKCQLQDQLDWPNVSNTGLLDTLETWLGEYLERVTTLQDLQKLDLQEPLHRLLNWPLPQKLDQWAPSSFTVPTGSKIQIDYTQSSPVLSVKLQEMFGCTSTPMIANNSVALVIHLLSPARRPLQVTQDLEGFWRTSYQEVKKEMKGRYPKHLWPDNPMEAKPTRFTKAKSKP